MPRFSRRAFLQSSCLLLTPTWGGGATAAVVAPSRRIRGGRVIIRRTSAWTTMDPHTVTNVDPDYPLVFDYLTRYVRNAQGKFVVAPGLAKRWTLNDNGSIDFHLVEGVVFHDGSKFDATVVAWNLERMLTNRRSTAKGNLDNVSRLEVIDPFTLRVHLSKPNAALLVNLSSAADGLTAMLSRDHVTKVGDAGAALQPIGTGPFRFENWAAYSKVSYTRWDQYWDRTASGARLPFPDAVDTVLQANDQTAILRLRSGSFDLVDGIPGSQIENLSRDSNVHVEMTPWRVNFFTMAFNARPGARFQGEQAKKIRQAAFAAIDKKAVAHAVGHTLGQPAFSPLVEGQLGYTDKVPEHEFDPTRARQLLREAGVTGRLKMTLTIISRQDDNITAQIYQQMLADVGIDVTIQTQDKVSWVSRIRTGDFELASFFSRGRPEADGALNSFYGAKGAANYAGLKDPVIEKLLEQGRSTYDDEKRQAIYERLQEVAHEHAYYNFVWARSGAVALSTRLLGYVPPFSGTVPDATAIALAAR